MKIGLANLACKNRCLGWINVSRSASWPSLPRKTQAISASVPQKPVIGGVGLYMFMAKVRSRYVINLPLTNCYVLTFPPYSEA